MRHTQISMCVSTCQTVDPSGKATNIKAAWGMTTVDTFPCVLWCDRNLSTIGCPSSFSTKQCLRTPFGSRIPGNDLTQHDCFEVFLFSEWETRSLLRRMIRSSCSIAEAVSGYPGEISKQVLHVDANKTSGRQKHLRPLRGRRAGICRKPSS